MLEIISAFYGSKDVKNLVASKIKNDKLHIKVGNSLFGDPDYGKEKKLTIEYILDKENKKSEIIENKYLIIPESNTKKLGIFYTNNNINPLILSESLDRILIASNKNKTDILVSSWSNIENCPFPIINCDVKIGNHFNIAYQISSLLMTASEIKKYDYVSFLEHDVLYGEDYFDFSDFSGNVLSNENFIGINKNGFQKKIQFDQPLHELTMKFDYAVEHYRNVLMDSITKGVNVEPPHDVPYTKILSKQPSIHVNNHGTNFTSHYNIYSSDEIYKMDDYWLNSCDLIEKLGL